MDHVWDTSKCPPKHFVTLCQLRAIQGHEVKKDQIYNFRFGQCDTCFQVTFSSRAQRMTLEHFLNGPNRTIFENLKITDILKQHKSGLLWHSKRQNSAVFQDIAVKFCTCIHRQVLFHIYSSFWKKKSWKIFANKNF